MYENHRKSFYRDERGAFDEERTPEDRWRPEGRRGYREGRSNEERGDWSGSRRSGYASSFRDDDLGRDYYGQESGGAAWREGQGREGSGSWAHDARHGYGHGASSYGYGAGQPYGGEGDSRYFTGQQGSWAMRGPYGTSAGKRFGADYRDHGYGAHEDEERGFLDRAADEVASWFGDEEAARRRQQDHRGRGPKDYKRSDERIREDANDRLTDDPLVDASSVTVRVDEGEVTLDGTVPSRTQKRRAEDLVDSISGVRHVQNNLRVFESASSSAWTPGAGSAAGSSGSAGGTADPAGAETTKI